MTVLGNAQMKAWEFLLQREGDHTWLPLETPTVEILEGRYRIVVRTPCPNEAVDIYISYVSTQDDPPKRRVQQRSRQTNAEGLMAFLPFTSFRTGRWELRCRPHVEPGSFEQRWSATIQLQVLEQEAATTDDLFGWDLSNEGSADSQQVDVASTDPAEDLITTDEAADTQDGTASLLDPNADIQQLAEQMSRMVVDSVLSAAETLPGSDSVETDSAMAKAMPEAAAEPAPPELTPSAMPDGNSSLNLTAETAEDGETATDMVTPESLAADLDASVPLSAPSPSPSPTPSATTPETSASEAPSPSPDLAIFLQKEMLTIAGDRQVKLVGELQPNRTTTSDQDDPPSLPPLTLTVELRDPSTTEVWESKQQTFPAQALQPLPFDLSLSVPTSCPSPLLLGTATLWQTPDQGFDRDPEASPEASPDTGNPQGMPEEGMPEGMTAISSAQFTVMAPVESLLSRVSSEPESETPDSESTVQSLQQRAASNFVVTKMGMEPTSARATRQVNTDLLGLLSQPPGAGETEQTESERGFRPVAKQQLPPKLEPRQVQPDTRKPNLDLPSFGQSRNPIFQWTPPEEESSTDAAGTGPDAAPEASAPTSLDSDSSVPPSPDVLANTLGETAEGVTEAGAAADETHSPIDTSATNEFAIPEEATLEELAELFGAPPPDLGMPVIETEASAEAEAQAPELNSPQDNIAETSPEEESPALAEVSLDDPLGSATARSAEQDAGQEDAHTTDTSAISPQDTQSGPFSNDPLLNRMHDLVVPQPAAPKESPAILTEVVVDDEELPATRMAWMQSTPAGQVSSDVAIGTPEMEIPEGDLVMGETIRVVLRVPTQPAQLCARVWLLDCQTRTLLTEPQWVTAFLPLSDEQVEASIELKVPEGSIELQVEAIAVDPNSQRESRKVAIRRTVVLSKPEETAAETDQFNPWMK